MTRISPETATLAEQVAWWEEQYQQAATEIEGLREELESAKAQVHIALHSNGFQLLGLAQTPNPGCSNSLCVYYRGLADTSTLRECGFCGGQLPCLTHSQSSPDRGGK